MAATEPSKIRQPAPAPVEVKNVEPLRVEIEGDEPPTPIKSKDGSLSLPPTTTEQQDIVAADQSRQHDVVVDGQQRINFIWENTQRWIALTVVIAGVLVNSVIVTMIIFLNKEVSVTQLALISISLQFINLTTGIVIGFYFSRTNHQNRGGIGPEPLTGPYTGR